MQEGYRKRVTKFQCSKKSFVDPRTEQIKKNNPTHSFCVSGQEDKKVDSGEVATVAVTTYSGLY